MLYRLKSEFATAVLFASFMLAGSCLAMAQTPPSEPVVSASRMVGSTGWALVVGQPYTLWETITATHIFSNGESKNIVREEHQMRDSTGRVRTEVGHPQDGSLVVDAVEIRDAVARTITILTPSNLSARVMHLPTPAAHAPVEHSPQQTVEARSQAVAERANPVDQPVAPHTTVEKLPSQTIAGVFTEGTRTTRLIPEGTEGNGREITVVTESWRSPELKIVLLMTQDDPRKDKCTEEVTELQRSEPDAALFQIPSDYSVVDDNASNEASQ